MISARNKVYKGKQGWRSAGFNITAISSFLSLALVALLVVGLLNNGPVEGADAPPFNVVGSLIVFAVVFLIWLGSLFGMAYLMRNVPRTVILDQNKIIIQTPTEPDLQIPFASILNVSKTQVPVHYLGYKASFRGVLIKYQNNAFPPNQSYTLCERDTTNFEDLITRLKPLSLQSISKTKPIPAEPTPTEK